MSYFNRLLLQCRSGFEKEAAAEITDQCANVGIYGYCTLNQGDGYLCFNIQQPGEAERAVKEIDFHALIFIRQWMVCGDCNELEREDRITQIEAVVTDIGFPQCSDLWVEYPDTTEGRELATFARKFSSALAQKLRKKAVLRKAKASSAIKLMLFALSGSEVFIGYIPAKNSAPWPMGIPRLKFPKSAPSRSTLKLEEAWHWFIPKSQWDERLAFGSQAVDLGAAPGGWTWQLVQRSMFVAAVDNGPMDPGLMETGQINHVQEDAYKFVPEQQVNLMVCDVVDKPVKTAGMAADWVINGWCQEAIFNLKLPMKQRYQEVISCLNLIAERFMQEGLAYELSAKHLYHDREEITCHLRIL
ncbi:23S rRNA (cytidine(2498)-2'-O)-methyltransferase RlmM [Neptuniibacter sp.]|uniref:23S rRNA (cytidine(2498)-2'-O)-methyltransferase RlmM n=1 Tax=Neptuniibacter sp. TaxID=1962643 RepID=UPI002617C25D|nr:23S rRNA (cytidine(2498)-2'-O)-methyltransferase RlmM [Neptuniibacter sp.]MCP4598181.1 23S rRNA (cytidine(2498)-2'-O)-methyltransferase RlmM [Neptuniibacter sp.]